MIFSVFVIFVIFAIVSGQEQSEGKTIEKKVEKKQIKLKKQPIKEEPKKVESRGYNIELTSLIIVLVGIGIYGQGRRSNAKLARAWASQMKQVFKAYFAQFPQNEIDSKGEYSLKAICVNEFELRATGNQHISGCVARFRCLKRHDIFSFLISVIKQKPLFDSITIDCILDSKRAPAYEFGFVQSEHEEMVRSEFPDFPGISDEQIARLPSGMVAVGDRNTQTLFNSFFSKDFMYFEKCSPLISYFWVTDRFPSMQHTTVASMRLIIPVGMQPDENFWAAQQMLLVVALNAAQRAVNGEARAPSNLIRREVNSGAGYNVTREDGQVVPLPMTRKLSAKERKREEKRRKASELAQAAHERKQKKLDDQRAKLGKDPEALKKFEETLMKKQQKKQVKKIGF